MAIPETTIIGGIPFRTRQRDDVLEAMDAVSRSVLDYAEISVASSLPDSRKFGYYCQSVAHQLLVLAGANAELTDQYADRFGTILQHFIGRNSFSWLVPSADRMGTVPGWLHIGNFLYTIEAHNAAMEAAGTLGQVKYAQLEIAYTATANPDVIKWVIIHEATHALLHESDYPGDCNDDAFVTPLGTLLYQLLTQNDYREASAEYRQRTVFAGNTTELAPKISHAPYFHGAVDYDDA